MTKKANYFYIGLGILGLVFFILISCFIYIIFAVSEYVKVVAVYEDGTFKMATEPNDLLQTNKKLSRFTTVYFDLENHTKETCKGTVKTKGINDSLNLVPEDGYINFVPKGEKVDVDLCGHKTTIDLSRL